MSAKLNGLTKYLFGIVACGVVGMIFYQSTESQQQKDFADAAFYGAQAMVQLSQQKAKIDRYSIAFVALKLKINAEQNEEIAESLRHLAPKPAEPAQPDSTEKVKDAQENKK